MSRLTGKTALVTGGGRGIGAAIARRLADEGADVALTYSRSHEQAQAVVKEIEAAGRRGLAVHADAADAEAVVAAVDRAAAAFGRLDILVNNAGIGVLGPLSDLTIEQLDGILAINVRSAFVAAQAAARHLGTGGRIVNLGSSLTEHVPFAGATLYTLGKAALSGLTTGLSRDLADRGVTVNLVSPGPIDTDMNPADGPMADGQRALTALGRFGTPQEVAAMVAYLVSDEAAYVTGANLVIDGGTAA